jgi:hypothetical protein
MKYMTAIIAVLITCTPVFCADKAKPAPDLPRVLIIGDSISIGYTPFLAKIMKDKAVVKHHKGNAQHTGTGLKKLDSWIGKDKWDLIHFNWGLWDICYRHPESKVQGRRDKVRGTLTTTPEDYEKNLDKLVERLKKTGSILVWANTTIVPEKEAGRKVGDAKKYNDIARKIMKKHGVPTNDLHALTKKFEPSLFTAPGNVHFTKEGSEKIAAHTAKIIEKGLKGELEVETEEEEDKDKDKKKKEKKESS